MLGNSVSRPNEKTWGRKMVKEYNMTRDIKDWKGFVQKDCPQTVEMSDDG
jgi:hypothetical protein